MHSWIPSISSVTSAHMMNNDPQAWANGSSISSILLTGQLPALSTLFFRISLSFFSLLHWNIRSSAVCMRSLYGHYGLPIIFNRCEQDRIFPWPVVIVVNFGLKFKSTSSLFSTLGKNSLVIAPFVVSSNWLYHFLTLSFWVSFFIVLFGILLYVE
jgi:hypothetical protein